MQFVCRTCSAVQSVVPERESICASCGKALLTSGEPSSNRGRGEQLWYTMNSEGQRGPFDADDLANLFDRNELAWGDSVWREGLRDWRPARRDEALVIAVANARGLDKATIRLDGLPRLLGSDVSTEQELDEEVSLPSEDTHVDVIPAGLSSSWPIRRGWVTSFDRATRRVGGSEKIARVLKLSTLALLAFVGGGLIVGLTGRLIAFTRGTPAVVHVPPPPVKVASVAMVSVSPPTVRPLSGEIVKRTLPALDEVRAELRRLGTSARRCVRDPKLGVELDVTIAGETGRPRQIEVRTPRLSPGAIECTRAAVADLQVAPFTADELTYRHKYAW